MRERDITAYLPAIFDVLTAMNLGLFGKIRVIGVKHDGTRVDVTRDNTWANLDQKLTRCLLRDKDGQPYAVGVGENRHVAFREDRWADVRILRKENS